MRVKARALGLTAEDYQNDKALDDGDLLYTGALAPAAGLLVARAARTSKAGKAVHTPTTASVARSCRNC